VCLREAAALALRPQGGALWVQGALAQLRIRNAASTSTRPPLLLLPRRRHAPPRTRHALCQAASRPRRR
jgi:hypothetical protein